MSRKIRHTLCIDTMTDIDLKNAHPTLLAAYCHQNNIPCKGLDTYVNDRENLLSKVYEIRKFNR